MRTSSHSANRAALITGAVAVAAAVSAPAASAGGSYCSPAYYHDDLAGREFCTDVVRTDADSEGRRKGFDLRLHQFDYQGPESYRLCVRPPRGAATCGVFPVGRYQGRRALSVVTWPSPAPDESSDVVEPPLFTHRGRGRYRVSWRIGGHRLGPELAFRVR